MRSMVCGQCHVEYYFGPKASCSSRGTTGLKVEQIEAHYDAYVRNLARDWTARTSAAREVLKAQHPEFETVEPGHPRALGRRVRRLPHAVHCAKGAVKVSDHHVRSPLLDVARALPDLPPLPRRPRSSRASKTIQDRTKRLLDRAEDAVVALIDDLEAAKARRERPTKQLKVARAASCSARRSGARLHRGRELDGLPRAAGVGAHPRRAIDYARQGQLAIEKK
jgi:nitrite reductase (cytochrome c-552)